MIDAPKTKAQARSAWFVRFCIYNPKRCAYEVFFRFLGYQCKHKPGHGPGSLYCKQHARIVERRR